VTRALLLRTDGTHRRVDLPDKNAHVTVSQLVADGDAFDCVHDPERRIRGYLHDRGLILGLSVNPVASLLFNMNLVGDVLVTNPHNHKGEADGYDYDLDDRWFDGRTLLTFKEISADESIRKALEEDIRNMDFSHHMFSLTEEQMKEYLVSGEIPPDARRVS